MLTSFDLFSLFRHRVIIYFGKKRFRCIDFQKCSAVIPANRATQIAQAILSTYNLPIDKILQQCSKIRTLVLHKLFFVV